MTTSNIDLIYALSKTPCFSGVFASDRLPQRVTRFPTAIVMNFDQQRKKGSHWVAVFIDGARVGYYFDSYGLPPFLPSVRRFLTSHCKKWSYGKRQLQSLDSNVCGQYSSLYLIHRSKKKSTRTFLKGFSKNKDQNDLKIAKRFANLMRRMRKV